eukprot:TRINITY_DN3945_c0_g1_i5.p1 TRINITY_DN3945_c0_g1~~TRINITY_DN3945_c0_g1_i5.p1  ORF type:complete len:202 (+),score=64.14 TRINITY_DN3945_c0_g1_i5:99-704(+)
MGSKTKEIEEMKYIVGLVLLVVAANCITVEPSFWGMESAVKAVVEAAEARNQAAAVKSAENFIYELSNVLARHPHLDYKRLEKHGYEILACQDYLTRLQKASKTILENAKSGKYQPIIQEKARTIEIINSGLKSCVKTEGSIYSIFRANYHDPACKEAMKKAEEQKKELLNKTGKNPTAEQTGAFLTEIYVACSAYQPGKR